MIGLNGRTKTHAWQINNVQIEMRLKLFDDGVPNTTMHTPAMNEHQILLVIGGCLICIWWKFFYIQAHAGKSFSAWCRAAISCLTSSSLCAAESEILSLAVSFGTVGGRIAGTNKPLVSKYSLNANASWLLPTINGCIAVIDGASCQRFNCKSDFNKPIKRCKWARLL